LGSIATGPPVWAIAYRRAGSSGPAARLLFNPARVEPGAWLRARIGDVVILDEAAPAAREPAEPFTEPAAAEAELVVKQPAEWVGWRAPLPWPPPPEPPGPPSRPRVSLRGLYFRAAVISNRLWAGPPTPEPPYWPSPMLFWVQSGAAFARDDWHN
jgi:hypothetical protein